MAEPATATGQPHREPHHGPYAGNGYCRASVLASERLDAKSWRSRANYLCSHSSSSPPFTHAQLGFWELLSVSEWDSVERQGSTRLSNAIINLLLSPPEVLLRILIVNAWL